jgi:hypothetical protein
MPGPPGGWIIALFSSWPLRSYPSFDQHLLFLPTTQPISTPTPVTQIFTNCRLSSDYPGAQRTEQPRTFAARQPGGLVRPERQLTAALRAMGSNTSKWHLYFLPLFTWGVARTLAADSPFAINCCLFSLFRSERSMEPIAAKEERGGSPSQEHNYGIHQQTWEESEENRRS